jgi:hypothetical protein
MKRLPSTLIYNGFKYVLVKRGPTACIYRQEITQHIDYYEVFLIKVLPEKNIKGTIIPEHEIFPRDKDFGYLAWTYRNYRKAIEKFEALEHEGGC